MRRRIDNRRANDDLSAHALHLTTGPVAGPRPGEQEGEHRGARTLGFESPRSMPRRRANRGSRRIRRHRPVRYALSHLGRPGGLDVVQLQCRIGTDTVPPARLGSQSCTRTVHLGTPAGTLTVAAQAGRPHRIFRAATALKLVGISACGNPALHGEAGAATNVISAGVESSGALDRLPLRTFRERWLGAGRSVQDPPVRHR